jgi:zinc/manganese transport system substrate-binding protein
MTDKAARRTATRRLLTGVSVVVLLAACGLPAGGGPTQGSGKLAVVAAENFWGSLVIQLGGDKVQVTSVVVNPATDPHAYEPTPVDARAMAQARYVVLTGAGYDAWAQHLLAANPASGRQVLNVADLVGKKEGDNPHTWYSPTYVGQVIDRVTDELKSLDPDDAAYFEQRRASFKDTDLSEYNATISAIRARYSGTAVGATESIFVYLGDALGLHLVSPPGYMRSVAEGTDPSAADKLTIQRQVSERQLKVLVFNAQNTTPEVNALVTDARAAGIPVVAITETLTPAGAKFQDWQTVQLRALLQALGG